MARTEVFIIDDANPSGHWVWIGGYEGAGVTVPVYATANGTSHTNSNMTADIAGLINATMSGTSTTTGSANATSSGSGGQYLSLTGLANSYATIPDEPNLDFTGSHSVRIRVRMPDWTPSHVGALVTKWPWSSGQWSWAWRLNLDGTAYFQWSNNGTTTAAVSTASPFSPAPAPNTITWLDLSVNRFTRQITISSHPDQVSVPDDGNPKGGGWTVIGQSVAGADTGGFYNSTASVSIGGFVGGGETGIVGDIFQVAILNSSYTKMFQLDPDNWTAGSTWVSSTGQTVTLGAGASIGTV